MTEQLKPLPCPFCGRTDIRAHVYGGGEPDAFMQCHDCSADGPNGLNRAGAIEAWNRRAQPAQAVPVLSDEVIKAEIRSRGQMVNGVKGDGFMQGARWADQAVRAKMGVAVPMTDPQVDKAMQAMFYPARNRAFVDGVRAAEHHHGIAGKEGA